MRRLALVSLVWFSLAAAVHAATPPELFQKAKSQFKLRSYVEALATLGQLEQESQVPENERYRTALAPGLAFYRGACLAALGRSAEARGEFEIFLSSQPTMTLDPAVYPKSVVAAFEEARKAATIVRPRSDEMGDVAGAYRVFGSTTLSREPAADDSWADSPVRFLLSADERREFRQIPDSLARAEFVTRFWRARDPLPETPENEFRQEFERRVAFADAHFAEDEIRGALTDRGMVFLMMGPPTWVGRRPIKTGEDTADPAGMSRYSRNDVVAAQNTARTAGAANVIVEGMTAPETKLPLTFVNWREIWHYRKEALPRGLPYHQVDFEFLTRKGYGKNVLQREHEALNSLKAAHRGIPGDAGRPASR